MSEDRNQARKQALEEAAALCLRGKTMTTEDQDGHTIWHRGVEMTAAECARAIRLLAEKE